MKEVEFDVLSVAELLGTGAWVDSFSILIAPPIFILEWLVEDDSTSADCAAGLFGSVFSDVLSHLHGGRSEKHCCGFFIFFHIDMSFLLFGIMGI